MPLRSRFACAAGVLLLAGSARASLITTLAGVPVGATLEDFNAFTTPPTGVAGSLAISPDVTLVNDGATVTVGEQNFSLLNNGDWNTSKTGYVSLNGFGAPTPSMTFVFAQPVSAVAFFLNYGFVNPNVSLIALDSANTPIEFYNLVGDPAGDITINIGTEGFFNNGRIRGISRPAADIAAFQIRGDFVAVDDLRFVAGGAAAAPEPGTLALLVFLLLPLVYRRRCAPGTRFQAAGTASPE